MDQLVSSVFPTRCLGKFLGRGMNISPADFEFGPGFGLGSEKPRPRSFSAMRWMADLGRVWESEAELRIRNLRGLEG